ncbi:MAG: hypothetical protein AAF944_20605 [Bacteroidota bacterium]
MKKDLYIMVSSVDKLNSLALACSLLIAEREVVRQQELSIIAAKVYRNQLLREEYYNSVKDWMPIMTFIPYGTVNAEPLSNN